MFCYTNALNPFTSDSSFLPVHFSAEYRRRSADVVRHFLAIKFESPSKFIRFDHRLRWMLWSSNDMDDLHLLSSVPFCEEKIFLEELEHLRYTFDCV